MPRPARAPATAQAGDRGQVALEFLGMLPLILLLIAAVWQCVLIGYAFSLAGNAADEAARAGAVSGDPGACDAAAREHIPGSWQTTPTCPAPPATGLYRVSVRLQIPALFPGLNTGLSVTGEAGAAMEEETG
ncbi:TadE/TadG family type IV pilus assembly protein [Streptomyces sp. NPDC051211]|uniref:TadE/TadG family type IV pilus assembly protein n=1 Tax=Streptomyces sp. NPDC051211 TaxID=3154643 RepID=UPI00344D5818